MGQFCWVGSIHGIIRKPKCIIIRSVTIKSVQIWGTSLVGLGQIVRPSACTQAHVRNPKNLPVHRDLRSLASRNFILAQPQTSHLSYESGNKSVACRSQESTRNGARLFEYRDGYPASIQQNAFDCSLWLLK